MPFINYLAVSWSVSHGRDTYGYNICRLDSRNGRARYRTCGGGYDMIGTVFAHWMQAEHQPELMGLVKTLTRDPDAFSDYGSTGWLQFKNLYGMFYCPNNGKVILDGACGIESMRTIAKAIGFDVETTWNKKGHTTGFYVSKGE